MFCVFYDDFIVGFNNFLRMTARDNESLSKKPDNFLTWPHADTHNTGSTSSAGALVASSNNIKLAKHRLKQTATKKANKSSQNCANVKFLVYVCRDKQICGGWGDRQKGIISVYLLAMLTNRRFAILYDSPCELTKFLIPRDYDWTLCSQYIKKLPESKIQNFGLYTSFKKDIINMNLQNNLTSKVVFIHANKMWIKEIMSHPKAAQNIPWAVGKTIPKVNGLVLSRLFQPSQLLADGLQTFLENISRNRKLICSHLRIGKNPTIPKDSKRAPVDVIAIFKFLKKFDASSRHAIYVASDSEEVKLSVKGNFTNGNIVDLPIIHVDYFFKAQRSIACDGLYTALLEQHILSRCDLLLLTRSNFGAMAAYMSPKEQEVFIYFFPNKTIIPVSINGIQKYYKFE